MRIFKCDCGKEFSVEDNPSWTKTFCSCGIRYRIEDDLAYVIPKYSSHYEYLDSHFVDFCNKVGTTNRGNSGLISAHGDKGYSYRYEWEKARIHFFHGMMLYLLFRCRPFSEEGTPQNVVKWVISNYERFKEHLPPVE